MWDYFIFPLEIGFVSALLAIIHKVFDCLLASQVNLHTVQQIKAEEKQQSLSPKSFSSQYPHCIFKKFDWSGFLIVTSSSIYGWGKSPGSEVKCNLTSSQMQTFDVEGRGLPK